MMGQDEDSSSQTDIKNHKRGRTGTPSTGKLNRVVKDTFWWPSSMEPPLRATISLDKTHKLTQP